jgi:hypothetical protein
VGEPAGRDAQQTRGEERQKLQELLFAKDSAWGFETMIAAIPDGPANKIVFRFVFALRYDVAVSGAARSYDRYDSRTLVDIATPTAAHYNSAE